MPSNKIDETIIIPIEPQIDISSLAKQFLVLKEDTKKLKATIREELKLEFGVQRPAKKDVDAITRMVIVEAKKIQAEEQKVFNDRLKAEADFYERSRVLREKDKSTLAKAEADFYERSRILQDRKLKKEQDAETRAFNDRLKAEADFYERSRVLRERQSKKEQAALDKDKRSIGTLGSSVVSSGAYSDINTRSTTKTASYNAFTTSEKQIAEVAKAQLEAQKKSFAEGEKIAAQAAKAQADAYKKSFMGAWAPMGTTLGHKIATTMQYMFAGGTIFAGVSAITSMKDAIVEADKAMGMFQGVLGMTSGQAKELQTNIFTVGKTFGGTTEDLNSAALALGRAGVGHADLAKSMQTVSQMALVSGDSLQTVTDLFISWKTIYPDTKIEALGNSITVAANATKASIPDLATASNYILTAGSQAGLSADGLLAMASSLIQIGKSSSTAGTEGRRFFEQVLRGSDSVKKAYKELGINVDVLAAEMQKSPEKAEAAMRKFYETIGKNSKAQVQNAVKGIKTVLDVAVIQGQYSVSQANVGFSQVLDETKTKTNELSKASDKIAITYEKMFERIVVAGKEASTKFEEGFKQGFAGDSTTADFNKKMVDISLQVNAFSINMGKALGNITSFISKVLPGIEVLGVAITALGIGKIGAILIPAIIQLGTTITAEIALASTMVTGLGLVSGSAVVAGSAIERLNLMIISNPIGLFVTLVTSAAAAMIYFGDKTIEALDKIASSNALKNLKKDLDLVNKASGVEAQIAILDDLEKKKVKQANNAAKAYNEEAGWFDATMSSRKKQLLEISKAHKEELKGIQAKREELKQQLATEKLIANTTAASQLNLGAGSPSMSGDKGSDKALRDAQRRAQDALDLELAAIRVKYSAQEASDEKANKLTELRKKQLAEQEAIELNAATKRHTQIDDHATKVLKSQEVINNKVREHAELINKQNTESLKTIALEKAKADIARAITDEDKLQAELAKKNAETLYKYIGDKADPKAQKAEEDSSQVEYDSKLLELRRKRNEEYEKGLLLVDQEKAKQVDSLNSIIGLSSTKNELDKQNAEINLQISSLNLENKQKLLSIGNQEDRAKENELLNTRTDILREQLQILNELGKIDIQIEGLDRITQALDKMPESSNKFAQALSGVSKGITSLSKVTLSTDKKKIASQDKYDSAYLDAMGDQSKLKKIQADFDAEQAEIKDRQFSAEMGAYAGLAGIMASTFEQGSAGAIAFTAVQSALGIASSWTAIAEAWALPFPGNLAAVAMVTSQVMPIIAQLGGSGGNGSVSVSMDAMSALPANEGKGSILGASDKASESIQKSLDIMGDLAKPEFRLMSQMTASLKSIDSKIGGVASLLLQQGGFAFGEGANEFSTSKDPWGDIGQKTTSLLDKANIFSALNVPILGAVSKMFNSMIGGIIGFIGGGLFGKTSVNQSLTDSGIYFANALLIDTVESFSGAAYQTISTTVTKKSWFSKSSSTYVNTYFSALDAEVGRQFSLVLNSLYDTTVMAGSALDISASDVEKSLANFVVTIGKISLKGKTGDEIQETLKAIFGKIGDDIAKTAFPLLVPFQKIGEGMFETMSRVAAGMEEAEYYINRLGKGFEDLKYTEINNKQGDVAFEVLSQSIIKADEAAYGFNNGVVQILESFNGAAKDLYDGYTTLQLIRKQMAATGANEGFLSSAVILGAGGLDELSDGMTSYFENFMSETEQFNFNLGSMVDSFSKLDLVMPTSREGFKDLLNAIDLSGEAGQELYGRLVILSDGFNELMGSVDDIIIADIEKKVEVYISFFTDINRFIFELRNDKVTTFSEFSVAFNAMIDGIASGATNLNDLGSTAMQAARDYLATVSATAGNAYDVAFANAVVANKFADVGSLQTATIDDLVATTKEYLGANSDIVSWLKTLNTSFTSYSDYKDKLSVQQSYSVSNIVDYSNNVLTNEISALRVQVGELINLNITSTATQIKLLSTQRATLDAVS